MEKTDKIRFFDIISKFKIAPFVQSRGYVEMSGNDGENRFLYFVDNQQDTTFALCGRTSRFFGKQMLQIESECYAEEPNFANRRAAQKFAAKLQNFYSEIISEGFDVVEIQSNTRWNFYFETALRQAGFLRPVGQFSMLVTRIINLTKPLEFDRNWKRNLAKAATENLETEFVENAENTVCEDFSAMYNAMSERKKLHNSLTAQQTKNLLNDKNYKILFVNKNGKRIAGIIVYTNQNSCTAEGVFACSSRAALETSATFYMYYALFQHLTAQGIKFYDMAKLLPSADAAIGKVFQFKNGVEGKNVILNGEFAWYKKRYIRIAMYFVKKFIFKKREL